MPCPYASLGRWRAHNTVMQGAVAMADRVKVFAWNCPLYSRHQGLRVSWHLEDNMYVCMYGCMYGCMYARMCVCMLRFRSVDRICAQCQPYFFVISTRWRWRLIRVCRIGCEYGRILFDEVLKRAFGDDVGDEAASATHGRRLGAAGDGWVCAGHGESPHLAVRRRYTRSQWRHNCSCAYGVISSSTNSMLPGTRWLMPSGALKQHVHAGFDRVDRSMSPRSMAWIRMARPAGTRRLTPRSVRTC